MTAPAPAGQWTPPTVRRSRWWVAAVLAAIIVAAAAFIAVVTGQGSTHGAEPTPRPTMSPPGLSGGGTFSMDSDTELWVSGIHVVAHGGSERDDGSIAAYSVSGPGFTTIDVRAATNTVTYVPAWGKITVEEVDAERYEGDGIEPTSVLHFRAVSDFPLSMGMEDFPTDG